MPRISVNDFEKLFLLVLFGPVAWIVPERYWFSVCRLVAKVTGRLFPKRRQRSTQPTPDYLLQLAAKTQDEMELDIVAGWHRDMVEILRCYRLDGWKPRIDLRGMEHVTAALAAGHGAILWVADFESASLIAKMALSNAGLQVSHLSRPQHGFSHSRFGIQFLNPIKTRIEDRFLKERITMRPGGMTGSLRTLRRRLDENALVSITVLHFNGPTATTDFMDGQIELPTGPATLAKAAGAPLLPVFTQRRGASHFKVTIEPPLTVMDGRDTSETFHQYAQHLTRYVQENPISWRGWQYQG